MIYGKPIPVDRKDADEITHEEVRALTDHLSARSESSSGQEYVDEYAQKVKAELKARQEPKPQPPAKATDRRSRTRTKRLPLSN